MAAGPIVELAGGVGGAKFAHGLAALVGERLTVVVNTADDLVRHGLEVSPDHDTVAYTLAGRDDRDRGWGLAGETWIAMEALGALGGDPWFRLGDRDLATHLFRTERLRRGERPTEVAAALRAALGFAPSILPMSDEPVRTEVRTDDGWLEFQDYFVRRRHEPAVRELRFAGVEAARPTPEVAAALEAAAAVLIGPSNPLVSIGPILALPGLTERLAAARARGVAVVAVSPIVAGAALKGPADRMLASLGHEVSALGVARLYAGIVDAFVIDEADRGLAPAVEALGIRAVVGDTIMRDDAGRARVARLALDAAGVAR
ncbi:MAG: lppg:fo 2-phospho-l-lactate transferase [Chloroflexota bacterium]